ncbi:MAG: IS1634 family transposase [Actinomycetota bacterium]|nr:IS1634 family transposase [Actinomycetota bacterium]
MEKVLGALPVVAEFCRRLDIAGIVDRACPIRDVALVTHGQVIEALIANRLTSPAPLVHVSDWARAWATEDVFGIDADALNDDRIGRALDAVAPALDGIVGSIGAGAIANFGIDVARLHWDMTSISLYGDYDHPVEDFVEPRYGHPKDRRPDLKQIQTGLAVTGDGAIPIFHRAYDGGAGEVAQVVPAMEALRSMAGERSFLMIGDSKLVSYSNLAAIDNAGTDFVAPASKTYVPAAVLAAQDLDAATPVDYVAGRDGHKDAEDRGTWRVSEDTMVIAGPRKADLVLELRRVFVWSSVRAGAAAAARDKKLQRARGDLERLTGGLGSRHYPNPDAVNERLNVIAVKRRVKAYLFSEVGTDEAGKPTLTWSFEPAAIDAEAESDGWYALLTNLDPTVADAAEVLRRYKGQEAVERRYGNFKGPLAVAPMFLKNNRRIEALISVICLALLIFCLVERTVRLALSPTVKLAGLWAGRPAKPTGRLIFVALSKLRLQPATAASSAIIPKPPPLQARLLELLGVDPRRQR